MLGVGLGGVCGGIEPKRKKRKNSWAGTTVQRLLGGSGVEGGGGGNRGENGDRWRLDLGS